MIYDSVVGKGAIWSFLGSERVRVISRMTTMRTMTRVGVLSRRRATRSVVGFRIRVWIFIILVIPGTAIRVSIRRKVIVFVGMVIFFIKVLTISMVRGWTRTKISRFWVRVIMKRVTQTSTTVSIRTSGERIWTRVFNVLIKWWSGRFRLGWTVI